MITKKFFSGNIPVFAFVTLLFISSCSRKNCPTSEVVLVLETAKDAWICDRPDYQDRNFGNHTEILAEGWTANGTPLIVRSLLEFDLSAIPENADVVEAKLYLQAVDNTTNGPGHSRLSGSNEAVLKWITESWQRNAVTWNNQPATSEALQILIPASDDDLQNYTINVKDMISAMLREKKNSHGFMLMVQNETHYRRMLFASSDYDDPAKWPRLIIKLKLDS